MNKISFYGIVTTLALSAFVLTSCDQDFNEIGSGIVDEDHFAFLPDNTATVEAFSLKTGVVQSNNLPINSLGIYKNPVFGKVKANFVTQVELATPNPILDAERNQVLDSVVLTIPYFSTKISGNDKTVKYRLDSIRGKGPINLKVYESGFVLNNLDPSDNFQSQQRYFTDQNIDFENNKIGAPLNNSSEVKENSAFNPSDTSSAKSFATLKLDRALNVLVPKEIDKRLTPRIRLKLDKAFFQNKIMNAPAGKLLNNSIFREYFKGIYFQVGDAADGTLAQLDFSKGDITLHYREYTKLEDGVPVKYEVSDKDNYGGQPKLSAKTIVLSLKGNTVSLLETANSAIYDDGLAGSTTPETASNLFLKGGEGSIAVIDLFGPDNFGADGLTGNPDGVADELNIIRNKGWLINEANLTFYVDRAKMGSEAPDPDRVYLFDLKNKRPLVDWGTDQSGSATKPKKIKSIHDGILQTEEGKGVKYRIRITDHIRNLIRKDSTNVRMGLAITESISLTANVRLKEPTEVTDRIPASSLFSPLGTVLFGSNLEPSNPNYAKRLKLEIYYTKPN